MTNPISYIQQMIVAISPGRLEEIAHIGENIGDFQLSHLGQAAIRERNLMITHIATMAITLVVVFKTTESVPIKSTLDMFRLIIILGAIITFNLARFGLETASNNFHEYINVIEGRMNAVRDLFLR